MCVCVCRDGGNGVHAVTVSAMAQWRSTAYTAWSLRTSPAMPSWIGSVTALSDAAFSLDAVVTLVAAHYNSSLQSFNVARVNFAQDQSQVRQRRCQLVVVARR